jgi:hypothetical protein
MVQIEASLVVRIYLSNSEVKQTRSKKCCCENDVL